MSAFAVWRGIGQPVAAMRIVAGGAGVGRILPGTNSKKRSPEPWVGDRVKDFHVAPRSENVFGGQRPYGFEQERNFKARHAIESHQV
jgi:hypothetical protein